MKKRLIILFIFLLEVTSSPGIVLAQEVATGSAEQGILPTTQPTPEAFKEVVTQTSPVALPQEPTTFDTGSKERENDDILLPVTQSLGPKPDFSLRNNATQRSAELSRPIRIRNLRKRTFRADEKITVIVENSTATQVNVKVYGPDGAQVPIRVEEVSVQDPVILQIVPTASFSPGRFRLKVGDTSGPVLTQDFTWGVLAINTNKSIYLPQEKADLSLAVLDDVGHMVCDADMTLTITDPQGTQTVLSTKEKKILVNSECHLKQFTEKPDYESSYIVGDVGNYAMKLSATTKNGTYVIEDAFEVRSAVPFDVERHGPTRIYPPSGYPVSLRVKASQDFEGTVTEVVPNAFQITPIKGLRSYDAIATVAATLSNNILEAPIFDIGLPYKGAFKVTQGFGEEHTDAMLLKKYAEYGVIGHDGIDFNLPEGTPVIAADDGVVTRAGKGDYGITVVVQHVWGKTYYGHLREVKTAVGEKIKKGEVLGFSGKTGLSTGAHLHFGIKPTKQDQSNGYFGKIDPVPYISHAMAGNTAVAGVSTTSLEEEAPRIRENDTTRADAAVKVLTWNLKMKKGETVTLGYEFLAPPESPQFYLTGPLTFKKGKKLLFQEARLWQIASDAVSNNGTFMYSDTVDTGDMNFRTYTDPTTVGAETTSVATSASEILALRVATSPTREEKIAIHRKSDSGFDVLTCTTGCDASGDWTLRGTYGSSGGAIAPVDVAYEQLSGRAMVIFSKLATAGKFYYCLWDGTSWTPATECAATFVPGVGNEVDMTSVGVTGQPGTMRLVPRGDKLTPYRTDEMQVSVLDSTNEDLFLAHWTGSAWNQKSNPTDTLATASANKINVAWEETTGDALAVWAEATLTTLPYATYTSAGGWSAAAAGPANNGATTFDRNFAMANDPLSDDISLITSDSGSDAEIFIWNGSAWVEGTDDITAANGTSSHVGTAWTRFSQRALFVYVDSATSTTDMECWTSGGGFTAVIGDVGNPNISNTGTNDDQIIVASPNNNRMLLIRSQIGAAGNPGDVDGLTYSDSTGCADADWADMSATTLGSNADSGTTINARTVISAAYTPYAAWSRNWRFYSDEASNDPSTGHANENTTPSSVTEEEIIRLRMQVAELGGMGQTDARKKLQYTSGCNPNTSETTCTWADVGDTIENTAVWRYATSGESCASCTDNTVVSTARLTGTTQNGTYVADKDAAAGVNMDHTALAILENDYPLKAEAVSVGTTYYFRMYDVDQQGYVFRIQKSDSTDCLSTTCAYPSVTIASSVETPILAQLMRHGKWLNSAGVEQPFTF